MDSPEGNRIAAALSPSSLSPAVQESPFYNYLSSLSPIKSVKAAHYTLRYAENAMPIPPPVFTSPRVDLQRETSFLQREDKDAVSIAVGEPNTHLNVTPMASLDNDVQSCSPSGCIDEYLDDPLESEDNTKSSDLCFLRYNEMPELAHNDFTSSGGTSLDIKAIDALEENLKTDNVLLSDISDEVGDYSSVESLLLVENIVEPGDGERLKELTGIIAESNRDPHHVSSSSAPRCEFAENAGVQYHYLDVSSQNLDECLHFVKTDEDSGASSTKAPEEFNKVLSEQECGSHRHLQFKARITGNYTGTSDRNIVYTVLQDSENSISPANATYSNLVSSHVETTPMTDSCMQSIASGCSLYPISLVDSTQDVINSTAIPTPSGFNSMSSCRSTGLDMSTGDKLSSYPNSEEGTLAPGNRECLEKDATTSLISASSEKIYSLDKEHRECQVVEQQVVPCEGEISASRSAYQYVVELNQVSPKRKRKKSACTSEKEGCKRCYCKRSRCLKLYCECFAAGVYCLEPCACENCFNKPEYDDTVSDTRKQIESRNPLAFAPRVVKQTSDSPARITEEGNGTTPPSARHKRGCNCKKSRCLKKYCECYQAKVGCSDGCRCESCHNSFGTKAEFSEIVYRGAERWEKPADENIGEGESSSKYINSHSANHFSSTREAFQDVSNLTPLSNHTPQAVTSDLTNRSGCSKTSKAQFPSSVSGPLHSSCFPEIHPPQLCRSKEVSNKLCSNILLCDTMKENEIPHNTSPTKTLKTSSPNQTHASPPHFQSERLSLNPWSDWQGGCKFIWQAVPTFPPLTPYKNSNDTLARIEDDHKDHSSDQ